MAEQRLMCPAAARASEPCVPLAHVNTRCRAAGSYGFVQDRTHDGRIFRTLNIVDEFTKEALAIKVKRKLNSTDVVDALTDLFILRGPPCTNIQTGPPDGGTPWGFDQAEKYFDQIEACCKAVGDRRARSKTLDGLQDGVHIHRCEHHFIVWLIGSRPIIIAILHERMDFMRQLEDRL